MRNTGLDDDADEATDVGSSESNLESELGYPALDCGEIRHTGDCGVDGVDRESISVSCSEATGEAALPTHASPTKI